MNAQREWYNWHPRRPGAGPSPGIMTALRSLYHTLAPGCGRTLTEFRDTMSKNLFKLAEISKDENEKFARMGMKWHCGCILF